MKRRAFLLRMAAAPAGAGWLAACTTIDSVKDTRGKGLKRTFKQPYEEVFDAVMSAADRRQLEIVSSARDSGTVLLSNGVSMSSLGERIAVFVSRLSDRTTSVEIVARPVITTVTFPPDWPSLLFGEIEEVLATRRFKR